MFSEYGLDKDKGVWVLGGVGKMTMNILGGFDNNEYCPNEDGREEVLGRVRQTGVGSV